MSSKIYTGGLFDGRGKPQPLGVRAKVKKATPLEKSVQIAFFGWRDVFKRQFPILNCLFSVPNGLWTYPAVAKAAVAQGLTAGIPDVMCMAPSADGRYHGLMIEFKRETTGKPTPEQEFFLKFFSDQGFRTAICRTAHDASLLVNEHLGTNVPVYPR